MPTSRANSRRCRPHEVAEAEANLAELAAAFTPDELRTLVAKQLYCWNQDGQFTDVDRATKRGIVIGKQGPTA